MANKITKKEYFKMIIEVLQENQREDLIPILEHEIELIEKKAMNGKKTKTQEANEDIKTFIIQELKRINTPVTITELLQNSPKLTEMTGGSNQKVSALITQLKATGQVIRETNGKKALFKVVDED